jgi:hypothetical protein
MILRPKSTQYGVNLRAGQGTHHAVRTTLAPSQTIEVDEAYRPLLGTAHWVHTMLGGKPAFGRADLLVEASAARTFAWPYALATPGVQGPSNPDMAHWTEQVYAEIARSKLPAVKVLANADVDGSVITRLKALGVKAMVVRVLNTIDASKAKTGREYVEEVIAPTLRLYQAGARHFEIHNEPNLYPTADFPGEGMGVSWQNGAEFARWWIEARDVLRAQMPEAVFGFSAMSPGGAIPNVRYDPARFMAEAAPAIAQADFICCHAYWDNITSSVYMAADEVLSFCRQYAHKPVMLTEFSNVGHTPKAIKGLEYVEFWKRLKGIALPNLYAAFCYTVAWDGDPNRDAWLGSDIADIVGQRISQFS